jgi:DNA-binding NarL/FixJ family response regulator
VRVSSADASTDNASDDVPAPPFGLQSADGAAVENDQYDATIINDLRYRLVHLGGGLEITSLGERGTRVAARIPYSSPMRETHAAAAPIAPPTAQSAQEETTPMPVEPVTVLIVDSQAVTRAGLHHLLEDYAGIQVVGEAADGVQAVSETLELGPQLVLMDTQLPGGQSLEALRQIKQLNQATRVLLLSTQDREEYLYETLRAGADGYVLKDIVPDELARAIRAVARGEVLVQPQLVSRLLSRVGKQGRGDTLTARELEVLRLLARGLRNKEIAARLYVSERTVNFHLANIYQKLNVSGRTEALSKALEQGLITA